MTNEMKNLDRYQALVSAYFDDVVKGKNNPYTSINGNMYSFLDRDGRICLRLNKVKAATFAPLLGSEPVVQYGSIMKDYVAVPETLFKDETLIAEIFTACRSLSKALPTKPTKRKK
ncbi:hypothetical protein [Maritalea sp.]|uniref:hypothetical protein n=1 Tax=Maritalea sp. TaxID=2003361 RepID=UPI003EF5AA0D